jgi:hypothetical protein
MTTMVRLVDAVIFPGHAKDGPERLARGGWKNWRGKWIEIELPPEEPNPDRRICGTKFVWRVTRKSLEEMGLTYSYGYAVCEHQIQCD